MLTGLLPSVKAGDVNMSQNALAYSSQLFQPKIFWF